MNKVFRWGGLLVVIATALFIGTIMLGLFTSKTIDIATADRLIASFFGALGAVIVGGVVGYFNNAIKRMDESIAALMKIRSSVLITLNIAEANILLLNSIESHLKESIQDITTVNLLNFEQPDYEAVTSLTYQPVLRMYLRPQYPSMAPLKRWSVVR